MNFVLLGVGFAAAALSGNQQHATVAIPESIRIEHEELHKELATAASLPGRTGAAAAKVAGLLHPHFVKEEEFALPPLALLQPLAEGRATPDPMAMSASADRLKAEMSQMLEEHKAIVAALADLEAAATAERHPEVRRFVEKLTLHAQQEEQVLYPAAVLVGEYLKLKRS